MCVVNISQQVLVQVYVEGVVLGDVVCVYVLCFVCGIVFIEVVLEVFVIDCQGNLVGQVCEEC